MERREFLSAMTALGALAPIGSQDAQRPEVRNISADVPPGSTLWALAVFLGEDPIEFTVGVGKDLQAIRGQYDAQRMKEYSWRNATGTTKTVIVRARSLVGDRELPPSKVEFISQDHLYVAFGRRGVPERMADRHGSYPFEAVFIGFVTFG
jgi:hypothetical protein